jgi:hypothetical protein
MEPTYDYSTVSQAINQLKAKGFTLDFNLDQNCISGPDCRLSPEQFEIVEVFRYEGNSDPADEAVVYAIESKEGKKGILVTGYGVAQDSISDSMLKKLTFKR